MKSIKESKREISGQVKLLIFLVSVVFIVSFFLAVRYSGENKTQLPQLVLDKELTPPKTNTPAGFYKYPFSLALSCSDPKLVIHYTLDGSVPTLESPVYSGSILINTPDDEKQQLSLIPTSPRWKPPLNDIQKGIVLRAIVVKNKRKSPELIRTFFIASRTSRHYTFPVIALTVNSEDFFGYKNGIYIMGKNYEDKSDYIRKKIPLSVQWWKFPANYLKRGDNSERPVHLEFFGTSGESVLEYNAGARINGNATRGFSQKSLRLCFDDKFSNGPLRFSMFPDYKVDLFYSLVLRNAGNDWEKTMIRDILMQSLMKDSKVLVQHYQPVIVFLNGEYWGIHNICERFDLNYLSVLYKIDKKYLSLLEISGGKLMSESKSDLRLFEEFVQTVSKTDYSKTENFNILKEQIDIESFMDMIIANVYFANSDWPSNNVKFWKCQKKVITADSSIIDTKWRWILYDTDWGFGFTGQESIHINLLEKVRNSAYIGVIFDKLLKSQEFRELFNSRFLYHLNNRFNTEKVLARVDQLQCIFKPEMAEHINRWRVIGSYSNWEKNIDDLRLFAIERPAIQRIQLEEFINKYKK